MHSEPEIYREEFLHWVWKSLYFDFRQQVTASGETLTVLDPGVPNPSDGPDFKNAKIRIGRIEWYGDVEMHWKAADWRRHGHHTDPNYNRVVLHVVYFDPAGFTVRREDGTSPYTLRFEPCLPSDLNALIARFHRQDRLPCAGHLRYISPDVFERQVERSQREYFEAKTNELLQYFDPALPPATAWKRVLTVGLFDGLGIALNREPMRTVGRHLFQVRHQCSSRDELVRRAETLAGFETGSGPSWNLKSCRPNNRPELRVRQGAELMWQILPTGSRFWNNGEPLQLWNRLVETVRTQPGIGAGRSGILYGTVFLPGLYLLGNLLHSEPLKQRAVSCWLAHKPPIPDALFDLYKETCLPPRVYKRRLGAVYQLKRYCRPRRCHDCEVLKQVISS